jgi:Rrf2 family protein
MVALAANQELAPILLKNIARKEDISDKYLSQLIIPLKSAGFIRSFRGAKGGYSLAQNPETITVRNIVEVMEGGTEIIECARDKSSCPRAEECVTRPVWSGLGDAIANYLDSYTLFQLAEEYKQNNGKALM